MNPRVILTAAIIPLALIIAAVPQERDTHYKLTPDEMLAEVNSRERFISPDMVARMIVDGDPSFRLIDVRPADEFADYSLPDAINLPLADLLSESYRDIIDQDIRINIFYSNGTLSANEAWILTRQMGYRNNYVLEGGLNYWFENILNPSPPPDTSPSEEFARYDFRKAAAEALRGGSLPTPVIESTVPPPQMPEISRSATRRTVAGGC